MSETLSQPVFDPFAPGFTDNPYPQYAALRTAAPVYEHPFGFWLLTSYEGVSWLLRANLSVEERNVASSPFFELREQMYGEAGKPRGVSMLDRDPPDHTRLRRLVSKAFTPRAVQALRPRITDLVDGMLDAASRERSVDLVEALAFPLPFAVIAAMLGTPPGDHERIRQLSGTVVRSLEPVADPALAAAIAAADAELTEIAAGMIAWKRANPADDLLTALIHAEDDGDVLDDDELIAQTLLLYIAGHETTVNLIAGGTLALLQHPDQLALLQDDSALIDNAVEELLRYDSPVQASRRITLEAVTISGVTIPAGAFVMASLGSANRDEGFFGPDAAEVRIDREKARQHVSFGGGPHHCLGSSLARLEATIAIARLTTRFPGLTLDGPVTWNGRINLRGPAHLPVSLGA
jgi:cytochrome P450